MGVNGGKLVQKNPKRVAVLKETIKKKRLKIMLRDI